MNQSGEIPELLSPAGDWEAMRAAVQNGADAVYFGLQSFNARHRANNFELEKLPGIIDYLHRHQVRGYVTCNTLIFSDELDELTTYIAALADAGVDAVIVQDLGLARLIQHQAPGLAIHASTQMTMTDPQGIEAILELGISRVILARELSLEDIGQIRGAVDIPVEVFVHGALCVAYSGQCLTSEAFGGRSANRGQCAQACRLPYDLIVDGEQRDLGELAYLLSPQDLNAAEQIDELVELGVSCLKIEGRLKSAEYVAIATQTYRAALDAASKQLPFQLSPDQSRDLTQSFSRGFSPGFLLGVNHQKLVKGTFPKSRGLFVGTVGGVSLDRVNVRFSPEFLKLGGQLAPGDGIVFDEGHPEQDEQGGRIHFVRNESRESAELQFGPGVLSISALTLGARVWKTDDPALNKRLANSFSRETRGRPIPTRWKVAISPGNPFTVSVEDDRGNQESWSSDQPPAPAQNHPLTQQLLQEQFERLGDSPFTLQDIVLYQKGVPCAEAQVWISKSEMNRCRRLLVEKLWESRRAKERLPQNLQALENLRRECPSPVREQQVRIRGNNEQLPQLRVLVRHPRQLDVIIEKQLATRVILDYEEVRRYEDDVRRCREAQIEVCLATLRIIKPKEYGWLKQIASYAPNELLVRNLAALRYFSQNAPEIALSGDYSLNVANELTASWLFSKGLSSLVPSYDLNWQQLQSMFQRIETSRFEMVIHQHMPMFHMEHCVFAHTLSSGKDHRDCGRPCDRHRVDLRDRVGQAHPLVADVGCRNTLFNAVPQSAAEYIPRLRENGIDHFRVELLREEGEEIEKLIGRYRGILFERKDPRDTWRELRVLNQLFLTRGPLEFE